MSKRKKTYYQPSNTSKMVSQVMKNRENSKIEAVALEKGLLLAMTIIFNPLIEDYWKKTASKRIPELAEQSVKLLGAVQCGVVEIEDCVAYVEQATGMKFDADWLKHTGDSNKIVNLRDKYEEFLKTLK